MSLSIDVDLGAENPVIRPDSIFPFSRMGGYYLSLVVVRLPVTANQVTTFSMIVGLSGAALFLKAAVYWNILATVLLVFSYMLDYSDGVVARLKNQSSSFGAAYDDFVDWIIDTAVFVGLGFGVAASKGNDVWMWLGLIAAIGSTVDYGVDLLRHNRFKKRENPENSDELTKSEPPKTFKQTLFYYLHTVSRAEFCFILLGLALFDVMWLILPVGAIGAQAFWLGDLFRKR